VVGAAIAGAAGVLPVALRAATKDSRNERRVMATRQAADEAEIRQLIARMAEAIRAADLDGLKACFAADIVSFDVGPQLQSLGEPAKLHNWQMALTVFRPPLGYEIRDLTITVGDDVAFGHSLNRLSGTMKNGNSNKTGPWVRYTGGFRKIHGAWLIAHDHVSAAVNVVTGRALLTLQP
jgi:ketosteroid isomerase-like protein